MKQDKRKRLKPLKYMTGPEMRERLAARLSRNNWWCNSATIDGLCRIVERDRRGGAS